LNKENIKKALEELKKVPKKNFIQSYDLIVNLKHFNPKQDTIKFVAHLHNSLGRDVKVGAFVGPELLQAAEGVCDKVIKEDEIMDYKDAKKAKALAKECDYFIAQANLMPKVAQAVGKVFGVRKKMPDPKMGCVVPPGADLKSLKERLAKSILVDNRKSMNIQCYIGKEDQPEEELIDNIELLLKSIIEHLPSEGQNVKSVNLKLTMSKPVRL
jgi:large subunit ribosomal protein L1